MALTFLQAPAIDLSDATTYTFSSQNLGTASADRYIIVATASRGLGATRSISSATIGGVSATKVAEVANTGGGNTSTTCLLIAAVPSGTTGDVAITYDSGMLRCGIGMWAATALTSATPTDTATSTADDPTESTLDVNAGGFAIAVGYTANQATTTWTGLTEKYDAQDLGEGITHSGASDTFASAQTNLTITCDFTAVQLSAGSFASWGMTSGHNTRFIINKLRPRIFGPGLAR